MRGHPSMRPFSGEGGIRTLERACAPYSLSRRVPSATRPPLRGTGSWPSLDTLARAVNPGSATDREALKARYEAIFGGVAPPFAFVDLDAMRAQRGRDARAGRRTADPGRHEVGPLPRVLQPDPGARRRAFAGLLTFTAAGDAVARRAGLRATSSSPTRRSTAQRSRELALRSTATDPDRGADPDGRRPPPPRPDRGRRSAAAPAPVRVCLDIDAGWWPLGGRVARVGPKRSPIHDAGAAPRGWRAEIAERPGTRARRADGLRGPDRRGRRPDRRAGRCAAPRSA